jgi:hypothetical protein
VLVYSWLANFFSIPLGDVQRFPISAALSQRPFLLCRWKATYSSQGLFGLIIKMYLDLVNIFEEDEFLIKVS